MIELVKNRTQNFTKFKTLKTFLNDEDARKSERLVEFGNWEFTDEGLRIDKKTYPMRDSAMKMLLSLFGMPIKFYYGKSPTDMLVRDVNRMRDEYTPDSEFIVHLQKENGGLEVRGIAKPDIKHVETHTKLLENAEFTRKIFNGASYSDLGLRLTTSDDEKPITVKKGDIINVGMELMYSDMGVCRTSGYPFLNRLVCTNGMVAKEKSPLVNGFAMTYGPKFSESTFLTAFNNNCKMIDVDSNALSRTFKIMRDNPVSALPMGEAHMKKMRSAIGIEKYDDHDKLTRKVMDGDAERSVPNVDLMLYDTLDIVTRLAKEYDYLNRRRIEGLAGKLVLLTADEFLD